MRMHNPITKLYIRREYSGREKTRQMYNLVAEELEDQV